MGTQWGHTPITVTLDNSGLQLTLALAAAAEANYILGLQAAAALKAAAPISYLVDATAGPIVQPLPAALTVGQIVVIQKTDATAHGVTASPNGTDTINRVNANSPSITLQNDTLSLLVVAVGAWLIF